jgi:type IV pilus assembly protein PilX
MSTMHMNKAAGQRGVTLVVVLLILVIVTLVGVGGARIALLGERSTRYDRDYLVASQAAEAALMDAEFDIRGPNTSGSARMSKFTQDNMVIFESGCSATASTRGLCMPAADSSGTKPVWLTVDYLDNDTSTAKSVEFGTFTGRVFDAGAAGVKPERPPRYIIEVIPDKQPGQDASKTPKMYRITAIGFGPRKEVQVVMQIGFRKEKG